jgi:hypothetical protein
LKLSEEHKVILATVKPLNSELLPSDGPVEEVDVGELWTEFWLQLTPEECPRLHYLQSFVPKSSPSRFTTRNMLRVTKAADEPPPVRPKRQVTIATNPAPAKIATPQPRSHHKKAHQKDKKKERKKKVEKRRDDPKQHDETGRQRELQLNAKERALAIREENLKKEEARAMEMKLKRERDDDVGVEVAHPVVAKKFKSNLAEKITLLQLAENAEHERHERALESIRNDTQCKKIQNVWLDLIDQ